jgi:hypothetical protein
MNRINHVGIVRHLREERAENQTVRTVGRWNGNLVVHSQYKLRNRLQDLCLLRSCCIQYLLLCLTSGHLNLWDTNQQFVSVAKISVCLWNDFWWFWWLNWWVAFCNTFCAFWLMCHPQSASLDVILFVLQPWDHLDLPPTPRNTVSSWNMTGRNAYCASFTASTMKSCSILICRPRMSLSPPMGRQKRK